MASELDSAAAPPQSRLVSLVVHIKLNGFANAAFRFTPSCLAILLPASSTPATHFAFRPKLIGLRIDRLELFILCPAINQFLRRPNRGRKDRTATQATKRRKTSVVYSSNKERESRTNEGRWTTRDKDASVTTRRSVNFTGEIIERVATPFNFIIRSNDAEDTPEKENRRLRTVLHSFIGKLKRERIRRSSSFSLFLHLPCLAAALFISFSLTLWRDILICRLRTHEPSSALERRDSMSTTLGKEA